MKIMNYNEIFENKQKFGLYHNQSLNYYTFRENDDKGEFIDENGDVVAQLYEAKRKNAYFIVAGMFMGDLVLNSIPYHRAFRHGNSAFGSRPHSFPTSKIIRRNKKK